MNTIFTLIGSYNRDFLVKFELQMVTSLVEPDEQEITNHKPVTDNYFRSNVFGPL